MTVVGKRNDIGTRGTGIALIIIGLLAVIAGILALVFPGLTLLNLIYIFGWFAIFAGVMEIIHAFTGDRSVEGRILLGLWGLITVIVGILALVLPGLTLSSFVILMAAYFFVTGVAQIVAAFRGHLHGWLLVWGVLGVLAGLAALVFPGIAALTLAIIFAVYAIIGGLSAGSAGISLLTHRGEATVLPYRETRAG